MSEQNENPFFKMGQAMFQADQDRATLKARIAELEAIVAKLPKTSSGEPLQVDMDICWVTRKGVINYGYIITMHYHISGNGWIKVGRRGETGRNRRTWRVRPCECFTSNQAAEEASKA